MPKASTFGLLDESQIVDSDTVPIITNAGENKRATIANMRNVVGPGWSLTINAANEAGATDEIKINAAIVHASGVGATIVFIPTSMLPYDTSLITYDDAILLAREGGSFWEADWRAYGAAGDGVTDDTVAAQAAFDWTPVAITLSGTTVHAPRGRYIISAQLEPQNGTYFYGDGLATEIRYTAADSSSCFYIGESADVLNYKNTVANLYLILMEKDTVAITLRSTCGAVCRDLLLEGDTTHGYGARTNIGLQIDGSNISAFYNRIESVDCNHMHIAFKVFSSGTSYATCQTFINCSGFGDETLGDTTSKGFLFTRDPVVTQYIGNGDGSAIIGGNLEDYNIGMEIEGGPIYAYAQRFEACSTAVHFTSTSGRNHIDTNRLLGSNVLSVDDDGIAGSLNTVRMSEDGGWKGVAKFSPLLPTTAFNHAGSDVHEFHNEQNSSTVIIYQHNSAHTTHVTRSFCATAAGSGWAHLYCESNGVDVAYIDGNGNMRNTNNSYLGLSDRRLKKNIQKAASQTEDVKLLARGMKTYTLKQDHEQRRQIGLIGQEVQKVSPGLVVSTAVLHRGRKTKQFPQGTPCACGAEPIAPHAKSCKRYAETLSVNYSVANVKAFKALGELIEKVEALEKKVARGNRGR